MLKANAGASNKKAALRSNSKRNVSKKVAKPLKSKKLQTKLKLTKLKPLTTIKRHGGSAVDQYGRELPVDYQHHHIHDPYDFFYADTSKVFDEHPALEALKKNFPTLESRVHLFDEQASMIMSQMDGVRSKITDQKELDAFDNVLVPALTNCIETEPLSREEIIYKLEQRGFTHPKHLDYIEKSWGEFFTNDLKYGSTGAKLRFIAMHATLWGSAAVLAYIGIDSWQQYFYDLEYPIHGHHDH